jgi:hypothetical protein
VDVEESSAVSMTQRIEIGVRETEEIKALSRGTEEIEPRET